MTVHQNSKESIIPYWVFKEMSPEAIHKHLSGLRKVTVKSRRQRRKANGKIK